MEPPKQCSAFHTTASEVPGSHPQIRPDGDKTRTCDNGFVFHFVASPCSGERLKKSSVLEHFNKGLENETQESTATHRGGKSVTL